MAGLEPARAFYGPTDFKSVASTISPHRRFSLSRGELYCGKLRFLQYVTAGSQAWCAAREKIGAVSLGRLAGLPTARRQ